MTAAGVSLGRVRDLLGRYVAECPYFWEANTDKRQCPKLWRHVEAAEQAFSLTRDEVLDTVLELAESRLEHRPCTIYISGRGGSGSHWLAEMLDEFDGFANAGEVSFPGRLAQTIAGWPLEDQGLFVDCVHLLHAWAGQAFPDQNDPPVVRPDVASLRIVNSNGDSNLLQAKLWEPGCLFIHLVRDPRDQVLAFTHRKPGSRANYPIEELDQFLRLMLIFNRGSLGQVLAAPVLPDLVCRYEDLRSGAAPSLRRIAEAAGAGLDPQVVEDVAFRHSAEARRQGMAPLGNLSRTPTRTWRDSASLEERLLMHAGLAEVIDTFGYEPDECLGEPPPFVPLAADVEVILPDGVVLGELHVRRDPGSGWERAGHAAGTFSLPAGTMARLRSPGGWSEGPEAIVQHVPGGALASLCLAGNRDVTDEDVAALSGMAGLVELDLARTRVSDDGVEALSTLPDLRRLSLVGTGVGDEAVTRLRETLPQCEVARAQLVTGAIRGRRLFDEDLITEPPR